MEFLVGSDKDCGPSASGVHAEPSHQSGLVHAAL